MSGLSGIGQQFGGELLDLAKKTVTETVKAAGSVAKGTAETVAGGSTTATQSASQGQKDSSGGEGIGGQDPLMKLRAQNKAKAQQRYSQLMGELNEYRQKEAQKRQQKEQVQEQQKMEDLQRKESDKRKRDEDLIRSTQRQYGGTGEAAKKQF